jgi:NAD(P)-dependent dehydrogenase (short-subunit alcohol dehydrogenase family)
VTLNALTVFYAHNRADDGIKVNALAPGLRRTDLNATAAASGGDPGRGRGRRGPASETATNPADTDLPVTRGFRRSAGTPAAHRSRPGS